MAKEYGGLIVLRDIDLTLPERGIFGLCGPNGTGKSTLLGIVGGSVRPSASTVTLAGEDITALPAAERFGRGVSRTFQAVHLIRGRTVLDNVAVACLHSQRSSLLRGIVISRLAQARADAMEALEYLGLGELAYRKVGSLTLETQRMVELARAMASRPSLLLLDEPASGLSEIQRERLRGSFARSAKSHACCSSSTTSISSPRSPSGSSCSRAGPSCSGERARSSVPRRSSTRC